MPEITSQRRVLTLLQTVLLIGIMSFLGVGCVATVSQPANEQLVDQLGVPRARERLKDVLSRSINPQVVDTEVTDDFFQYRYRQAVMGIPTGAVLENKIFFVNAGRIDVFANNLVNVYTSGSLLLAQIVFGNADDARTFADLVSSFRVRRAGHV
jgi:hypothetical protein